MTGEVLNNLDPTGTREILSHELFEGFMSFWENIFAFQPYTQDAFEVIQRQIESLRKYEQKYVLGKDT